MKVTTGQRLKQLMQERDLKQVDILRLCEPYCKEYGVKMGRNDLSQYINDKVAPGQWKLTILAKALGVQETWLMGYDVPRRPVPELDIEMLDPDSSEIFNRINNLPPEKKAALLDMLKLLE